MTEKEKTDIDIGQYISRKEHEVLLENARSEGYSEGYDHARQEAISHIQRWGR